MSIQNYRFEFNGKLKELFGIWLVSFLLSILTLGIYSFWGKTRIRHYLVGSVSLRKDAFEYIGTGKELFIGFLKALPIIIIISVIGSLFDVNKFPWIVNIVLPLCYLYLIEVAIYSAMKYRFSRTTWLGIQGRLMGSAWRYGVIKLRCWLINILSLGLMIPSSDITVYQFIMKHAYFGNGKFIFNHQKHQLNGINVITMLLFIPTLGCSRFWYLAALKRYLFNHTSINHLQFNGTQTGFSLLSLKLGNILIFIFSLGLGTPLIMLRNLKYFMRHVTFSGDIDTSDITQAKSGAGQEGFADAMNVDFGFM